LTRIASLARSWASASVSVEALTTVPMPPFHSRSTGARNTADTSWVGVNGPAPTPSTARARSLSSIDLAVRGYTPPPAEMRVTS